MAKSSDKTYVDSKGRLRWHVNDELAERLKRLYDFLVIGNYEESHAARYPRLAHAISRHPESFQVIHREGRLEEFPGIGGIITEIVSQLLETGSCQKMKVGDEFFTPPPLSVLELTEIPRLGAKTARTLYQKHGIDSLAALESALEDGSLAKIKGIGKGMLETIRQHIADHS